MHNVTGKY